MMIDTQTKLTALLGHPVSQSYSAVMHNAAFRELGLNSVYFPIECPPEALKDIITGIRRMSFAGFNVTKPLKLDIIPYMDALDETATQSGAVNTVKKDGTRLTGYNTDGDGFVDSLREAGFTVEGKRYAIIGAGGSARAVAASLVHAGAREIVIAARRPETAHTLAAQINSGTRVCAFAAELNGDALIGSDCVINSTGVGMYPDTESSPVDKSWFDKDMLACDLTYNPSMTRFLLDAEAAGAQTLNGLGMLIYQGVRAFELWFDIPAPLAVMRTAAEDICYGSR